MTQDPNNVEPPSLTTLDDPRRARTLYEASRNPDGTYNGLRALSWMSEALCPGRGIPLEEVQGIADRVLAEKRSRLDVIADVAARSVEKNQSADK